MIKLETHCHIKGGSFCADGDIDLLIKKYKEKGYGAIIVTTHYALSYYSQYPGKTHKEKIDYFFKLYDDFSIKAKKQGIKTFFGTEVLAKNKANEFMLLGFDREFLYQYPPLFELTQAELFDLANKHNIFMYQTHPFRKGISVGNPLFMHGAEIFNGHYHHKNNNKLAKDFCEKYSLIGLSGSDYHHDSQPITAGIYIPKEIETEKQLVEFIRQNKFEILEDSALYENSYSAYLNGKI